MKPLRTRRALKAAVNVRTASMNLKKVCDTYGIHTSVARDVLAVARKKAMDEGGKGARIAKVEMHLRKRPRALLEALARGDSLSQIVDNPLCGIKRTAAVFARKTFTEYLTLTGKSRRVALQDLLIDG
jgi:hypothetical protein